MFRSIQIPHISQDPLFTPCSLINNKTICMDSIAWVWYITESNLFHIFKSCHVWFFKRLFSNQACMHEWVFSSKVAMAEETEGEVIGIEAQEGQYSPYILMLTHKRLAICFRPDFSIGLGKEWSNVGLKGLLSKFWNPLVLFYPLMSHCNPRFLKMTNGKRLSTRKSPKIVAGPICLCLLPHLTIR